MANFFDERKTALPKIGGAAYWFNISQNFLLDTSGNICVTSPTSQGNKRLNFQIATKLFLRTRKV